MLTIIAEDGAQESATYEVWFDSRFDTEEMWKSEVATEYGHPRLFCISMSMTTEGYDEDDHVYVEDTYEVYLVSGLTREEADDEIIYILDGITKGTLTEIDYRERRSRFYGPTMFGLLPGEFIEDALARYSKKNLLEKMTRFG